MKFSDQRKCNEKLRARYMTIIKNAEELPWDERTAKILADFFTTDKSYAQIGQEVGLSRSRIGQILKHEVRRIMHPSGLRKYWEPGYIHNIAPERTNDLQIELEQQYGEIENWPIAELPFSPRTRNSLLRANITTVGVLLERLPSLAKVKGISKRSMNEIEDTLHNTII